MGRLVNGPIPDLEIGELKSLMLFTQKCLLLADRGDNPTEIRVTRETLTIGGVDPLVASRRKAADHSAAAALCRAAIANPPAGWKIPTGLKPAMVPDLKSARKYFTIDGEFFSEASRDAREAPGFAPMDQINLIHLK
jgi:hypothetical protein